MYVPVALLEDLHEVQRSEMVDFFMRELRTPHWMRALSLSDPMAEDPKTLRDDHGWTGAYSAWPALSAQSLAMLHDKFDTVVDYLRSLAVALDTLGPFGQAAWVPPENRKLPFKES